MIVLSGILAVHLLCLSVLRTIFNSMECLMQSRNVTSAACHRMSTFLFFLAWTFCPRNLNNSGRQV